MRALFPNGAGRAVRLVLVGLAGFTAGCGTELDPFAPETVAVESIDYTPGASSVFCYSTLANADCYAEPQPGPPNRFISGYIQ